MYLCTWNLSKFKVHLSKQIKLFLTKTWIYYAMWYRTQLVTKNVDIFFYILVNSHCLISISGRETGNLDIFHPRMMLFKKFLIKVLILSATRKATHIWSFFYHISSYVVKPVLNIFQYQAWFCRNWQTNN